MSAKKTTKTATKTVTAKKLTIGDLKKNVRAGFQKQAEYYEYDENAKGTEKVPSGVSKA